MALSYAYSGRWAISTMTVNIEMLILGMRDQEVYTHIQACN
jgi:hypothetical protein